MQIKKISWQEIYDIWSNCLWPDRPKNQIRSTSAMLYANKISIENHKNDADFFGIYYNDMLIAVNSGHLCTDKSYRSRGLWCNPNFRRLGLAKKLLNRTVQEAIFMKCAFVWSLPRYDSRFVYESVGFVIENNWFRTDTSPYNAYAVKKIK